MSKVSVVFPPVRLAIWVKLTPATDPGLAAESAQVFAAVGPVTVPNKVTSPVMALMLEKVPPMPVVVELCRLTEMAEP